MAKTPVLASGALLGALAIAGGVALSRAPDGVLRYTVPGGIAGALAALALLGFAAYTFTVPLRARSGWPTVAGAALVEAVLAGLAVLHVAALAGPVEAELGWMARPLAALAVLGSPLALYACARLPVPPKPVSRVVRGRPLVQGLPALRFQGREHVAHRAPVARRALEFIQG